VRKWDLSTSSYWLFKCLSRHWLNLKLCAFFRTRCVGSKVTLACAQCKTVWNTEVGKKKGFLAWFEPKTKHLCPGCGGYMTVFAIGKPGPGLYGRYYIHTCSICGPTPLLATRTRPDTRSSRGRSFDFCTFFH
jgi:hypothetical protein